MANNKQVSVVQQVAQGIGQMEAQISRALPKSIPSERFVRTAQMAVQNDLVVKALNNGADRSSLYKAVEKCAQDGLVMDGREAALVPFGKQFQYMPMVAGILKKAFNTGEIASISCHCVYENDYFSYELGDEEHIKHIPSDDDNPGKLIKVYAIGRLKSGGVQRVVMNRRQVMKHKDVSKNGAIWKAWEEEMWEKTALKKLMKRMPQSSELERLWQQDNEGYEIEDAQYEEVDVTGTSEDNSGKQEKKAPAKKPANKSTKARDAIVGKGEPEPEPQQQAGSDDEPPLDGYEDIAEGEFEEVGGEEQQDLI